MNHNFESYDVEPPNPVTMLAGMVSKTADEKNIGWLQAFSIRMPMHEACLIEALANHSGQSRNKIAVQVIKAGLFALWQEIPGEDRLELERAAGALIHEKLQAHEGEGGEV